MELEKQMIIPSSQQSTKGSSHRCRGNVDSNTEQKLVALVEAGDEECQPARYDVLVGGPWNGC
jgi:hypothetical protein